MLRAPCTYSVLDPCLLVGTEKLVRRIRATVSLDEDCQNFVVCTEQGFELWDFERMIQTKEIEQAPISLSLPKHACFSEWKTKVIGGTDRACAEVYDVTNGRFEQRLAYPQGGLVQAVAVSFPTFFQLSKSLVILNVV